MAGPGDRHENLNWPGRRVGAGAVVRDEAGRVLLVRHSYGRLNWEIPGGASEPGESVVDTAMRELQEETGLAAVVESLSGIYWRPDADNHHFVFRCALLDTKAPRPRSPEISECAFFPADDLPRPISNFTVLRIRDALAKSRYPLPVAVPPLTWLE